MQHTRVDIDWFELLNGMFLCSSWTTKYHQCFLMAWWRSGWSTASYLCGVDSM